MAIGRISVKTGGKGRGESHAKYILRQDKYKLQADKKEKLGDTHSGNMPSWAKDNPMLFWRLADEKERKNGSVYREHILSLPRELNDKQQLQLVKDWINQELGDKHPYTFAIHRPLATDGKEQPHCHLMFCERELDGIERGGDTFFKRYNSKNPEKGGARKTNTGLTYTEREEQLKQQRERWGELVNKHLKKAKSKSRVDMRNWEERGLSKKPINLTMKQFKVYGDEFTKNKIELAKKQRQENRKLAVKKTIDKVKGGIAETVGDIKKGLDILTVSIHADIVSEKEQAEQARQQAEQQRIAEQARLAEQERLAEQARLDKLTPTEIIDEYGNKIETIANDILRNQLQALKNKGKPLLASYEKLKDNEPLFFDKEKWRKDKEQALNAYNAVKKQHDTMIAKGITDEHRKQAGEQLAKDDPSYNERVKQAIKQEYANRHYIAVQHGADLYAIERKPYYGKIIKSDDKMSLQKTENGIVYHHVGGLEVGKNYTLTSYGYQYGVTKDYEQQAEQQRLEQARLAEQQQQQQERQERAKTKQVNRDDKGR